MFKMRFKCFINLHLSDYLTPQRSTKACKKTASLGFVKALPQEIDVCFLFLLVSCPFLSSVLCYNWIGKNMTRELTLTAYLLSPPYSPCCYSKCKSGIRLHMRNNNVHILTFNICIHNSTVINIHHLHASYNRRTSKSRPTAPHQTSNLLRTRCFRVPYTRTQRSPRRLLAVYGTPRTCKQPVPCLSGKGGT